MGFDSAVTPIPIVAMMPGSYPAAAMTGNACSTVRFFRRHTISGGATGRNLGRNRHSSRPTKKK